MPAKFVALFLAGIALSGCMTANSSMANLPAVSAAPQAASVQSDGLDELPAVTDEPREQIRPKPKAARNVATRPTDASARAQTRSEDWTRAPNEDPEADAKLARHLRICKNC
ncbi:MAG: hypothetical protein PS018_05515 [bacterium]|nr:hypothetical protein [bacterium]